MKIIGDIMTSLFPIFRYDYRKQRMSFCLLIALFFVSGSAFGQASISGNVTDVDTGEAMHSGKVNVYKNDFLVASSKIDSNGNYSVSKLDAGNYDIILKDVGSIDTYFLEIFITDDNCVILDAMVYNHYALAQPTIIKYQRPLINQEKFNSGQTFTAKQINNLPNKN